MLCLLNARRAATGAPALSIQGQLTRGALDHARDMVANHYFSHRSRDGRRLRDRLQQSGYIARGQWFVGETLAWASGARSTPQAIVDAFMDSPTHREVLLNPRFRDIGVAFVRGTPTGARAAA